MSLSADGTLSSIYCLFRSCLFFWLCWALSLSVWLFATPWSAAHQAPLSVHGDSPGKNTGVGCHTLLQGIFPIQRLNPGLPHCRQILYQLSYQRSPKIAGVGSLSLLQQIFLTQELNWGLLHCRRILYQLTSLCFSESISCEKEISPAILINKTCHSHQWFLAPNMNEGSQNCDPADAATPLGDCWGAGGMQEAGWIRKQTGLAPDISGTYERNECSEPRGLPLRIHWMLKSLTWYLIFDVQTACSLYWKFVYRLTPPPAFLKQFSLSFWDAISWAPSPKHSHQIK